MLGFKVDFARAQEARPSDIRQRPEVLSAAKDVTVALGSIVLLSLQVGRCSMILFTLKNQSFV